jgi:hypothetical protein
VGQHRRRRRKQQQQRKKRRQRRRRREEMANVDEDLLRAAEEGNYDGMLTSLENGASVHYVGDMGWYPPSSPTSLLLLTLLLLRPPPLALVSF